MANKVPEINASSMADVAFLLLIFFLVTTTVDSDKGILVTLPQWSDQKPEPVDKNPRNLLNVSVNFNNEILVRGKAMKVEEIREMTKRFLISGEGDMAEPGMGVVSYKNDRGTSYGTYVSVYNELKAGFNEAWNIKSKEKYAREYTALSEEEQKEIRTIIPFVLSESEPTAFGQEQ